MTQHQCLLNPQQRAVEAETKDPVFRSDFPVVCDPLQGRGRSLYLQRRGHMKPEDKFSFPLLSSWEYGWRLGKMELVADL